LEIIGIFTPGIILPCLSLLSSIMQSISFDIPKKLSAVVAFAGAPYPINLFPSFFNLLIFLVPVKSIRTRKL